MSNTYMPPPPSVTVPLQVSPELLAKVRAAADAVSPGKKGKIVFSLDAYGNLQAGVGLRLTQWITIGAYGTRSSSGAVTGAVSGTIEFEPAP